ncbi:MAG: hypothetical protein JWM78_578 [Verrucomicrobiaceae bacterium]|nr:hypothetical protein [Verrucomicrobiaceae bacterium]
MSPESSRSQFYDRWLARRIPRARSVVLDQRRVFIFPSRTGLFFLLVLAVMLIAAINYQNNMAFALVFFLFSLFVVVILHTYSNLSGLRIEALRGNATFAGEIAEFDIQIERTNTRNYHSIALGWPGQPFAVTSLIDKPSSVVKLFHASTLRGWLQPARLSVATVYPLGLLRAWTWIDLDIDAVVYPRPLESARPLNGGDGNGNSERLIKHGSEEFHDFRPYRRGDNLRHVMWRSYAKGQPLQSKQFAELLTQTHWLDYDAVEGNRERRLSVLCFWVLELQKRNEQFGVKLPGQKLAPGSGEEYAQRALRMLALFESDKSINSARAKRRG